MTLLIPHPPLVGNCRQSCKSTHPNYRCCKRQNSPQPSKLSTECSDATNSAAPLTLVLVVMHLRTRSAFIANHCTNYPVETCSSTPWTPSTHGEAGMTSSIFSRACLKCLSPMVTSSSMQPVFSPV